ncbi:hypothetical protein EVJ58_g11086 [Rhodofomes roseus]|nr:hypothetical protein EVJ58_g11086 [Rhodofomes roseus]
MIPRSKLARRVATNARRTALAARSHYATAAEDDPAAAHDSQRKPQRRIREKEANFAVSVVHNRMRKAERDERMDITAALTEVKT